MITIREIETALNNYFGEKDTYDIFGHKVMYSNSEIQYFLWLDTPYNEICQDLLDICDKHKKYFFKKQHVEYGTIDYGINELIEDLRSWL